MMKKIFLGLLTLSLVLAFSMPAAAVDVSVSGSYYVAGYYDDNGDLMKEAVGADGSSSAWYNQRLRVETIFKINPALKLVTRFDAMEGYWDTPGGPTEYAAGRNDDNIDFDRAYIDMATKYGILRIGYQREGTWGTIFGNTEVDAAKIVYNYMMGKWLIGAEHVKWDENDQGTDFTDGDNHTYDCYAIRFLDKGVAGFIYVYVDYASSRMNVPAGYDLTYHLVSPYFKKTFGNLYVEGELWYCFGSYIDFESDAIKDIEKDSWSAYINAKYSIGNAYVGGQIAWVEGDDPKTRDNEAGKTGSDYSPCLILWNDELVKWSGQNLGEGLGGNVTTDTMTNAWLYQIYAGISPMPKLDLFASFSYAKADEKGNAIDDEIGQEIDVTGTYKVFDNLEYMVGFGYFIAGDWYKANKSQEIENDYVVMHKLTLTF